MYKRKLLHLSMGFFALTLRWLTPWQAMLCALVAFLHNLYIFPLYGRKKLEKEEEKKKGYTAIVSYPAVVFAIIGLAWAMTPFGQHQVAMALAAASWAILAFGDAIGAIVGMSVKGPKLPWNGEKTFSGLAGFTVSGAAAAYVISDFAFFRLPSFSAVLLVYFLAVSFLAAIVESLDGQFDDNLGFPFAALSVLLFLLVVPLKAPYFREVLGGGDYLPPAAAMAVNIALASAALARKWVSPWGFVFGLFVGFSVILSLGVKGFAILCLFYLFANFSTFYGKKIKEARGIAEGNRGTRGLESVFSKGLAPAVFCWFSFEAFVVTLAFYAADTVATEFGKTSEKGTFSLLSLKSVKPGTVGAVSVKGTTAGVLSIFAFLMAALVDHRTLTLDGGIQMALFGLVLVFFILESIVNELNAKYSLTSKTVIHVTLGFVIGALSSRVITLVWT